MLEVSLSICKKDPNQWSIDERIEGLAGALIHRYLINDGSIHPAVQRLLNDRGAIQGLLDQVTKSDQIHRSLQTLLAVQMLLRNGSFDITLTKHREYLTGIVDHNINELNDWIASISRETDILWCETTGSFIDRLIQDPDHAFVVNLGFLNITDLPQGLSQLRHLKYLNLRDNQGLFSNPQSMEQLESLSGCFSSLEHLDLSWTNLTSAPSWIFQLPSLTFLDIGYTRVTQLCKALPTCCLLEQLRVFHSQLSH